MDYKDSAEYFIANGVTFQKWIPVTERLPDDFISVIIYIPSESPFPMVKENGWEYAIEKLRESCEKITGMEVRQVHEEEMIRARKENEAKGIFFPAEARKCWLQLVLRDNT